MMTIQEIAKIIESWAPLPAAESYDNVGLLVGYPQQVVTGVLINLDVTEALIEEAIQKKCNLIVTHHPIWFSGRKRLNGEDYVSRIIMSAIKNDIALYACHTNLDNIQTGVNQKICDTIGLKEVQFLSPKPHPIPPLGSGMIGTLAQPLSKNEFLTHIKSVFQCGGIRFADASIHNIQKVAVCGGSGSFLIADAIRQGADAFVTADITYHKYFDNENRILLLDIGHYESEQYTSELLFAFLSEKIPNFALYLSDLSTNPVKYF